MTLELRCGTNVYRDSKRLSAWVDNVWFETTKKNVGCTSKLAFDVLALLWPRVLSECLIQHSLMLERGYPQPNAHMLALETTSCALDSVQVNCLIPLIIEAFSQQGLEPLVSYKPKPVTRANSKLLSLYLDEFAKHSYLIASLEHNMHESVVHMIKNRIQSMSHFQLSHIFRIFTRVKFSECLSQKSQFLLTNETIELFSRNLTVDRVIHSSQSYYSD